MSDLRVERDGPVLRLTVDREERRNALGPAVLDGMVAALRDVGDARVVVVTGAGEKAFCSGADLAAVAPDATGLEQHEARAGLRELLAAMRGCPAPVVARVRGLCLAGGVGLLLGCDLAVAADDAAFGLPEVDLGLWPFMVSALVARHVPPKRALDWMLTGRRLDAATAYDWGLVSRVVPAAHLDATVDELCATLAAKAPVAVRLGKAAWYDTADVALGPALAYLQTQLSLLTQTKDAVEGVTAFFAKRPPEWTGR